MLKLARKCSYTVYKWSLHIHMLAIVIVAIGLILNIYETALDKHPFWLPLSLAIMFLLKLPHQLCSAINNSHAWLTVIGSTLTILSFTALTILIILKNKKNNKSGDIVSF